MLPAIGLPAPVMVASGMDGNASSAATEIADVAAAGALAMYGTEYWLPAEATTTTPVATRLSVAIASGSSFAPNGAPSDMLTTSMPSAWEAL